MRGTVRPWREGHGSCRRADLTGANLSEAILLGANLTRVRGGLGAGMTPPADGVRSLRPDAPPVPRCGAVVLELARPGCAPNAATVEAVTAAGARPAERWRRTAGAAAGRILEVAAPPGDGWPDAGAAPLVVAAEPDPDFGKAPVLHGRTALPRQGAAAVRACGPGEGSIPCPGSR